MDPRKIFFGAKKQNNLLGPRKYIFGPKENTVWAPKKYFFGPRNNEMGSKKNFSWPQKNSNWPTLYTSKIKLRIQIWYFTGAQTLFYWCYKIVRPI